MKTRLKKLFIVVVSFGVFQTCNVFNFLINFTFLTATYFSEARYSLLCWKCC